MKNMKQLLSVAVRTAMLLGCLAAGFLFGCPLYNLLGIPCPCCGVTRAWIAFFSGQIAKAFQYHGLFPAVTMAGVIFVCADKMPNRWRRLAERVGVASAIAIFAYAVLRWCGVVNMP